jgi:hypothetical protein
LAGIDLWKGRTDHDGLVDLSAQNIDPFAEAASENKKKHVVEMEGVFQEGVLLLKGQVPRLQCAAQDRIPEGKAFHHLFGIGVTGKEGHGAIFVFEGRQADGFRGHIQIPVTITVAGIDPGIDHHFKASLQPRGIPQDRPRIVRGQSRGGQEGIPRLQGGGHEQGPAELPQDRGDHPRRVETGEFNDAFPRAGGMDWQAGGIPIREEVVKIPEPVPAFRAQFILPEAAFPVGVADLPEEADEVRLIGRIQAVHRLVRLEKG